MRAANQRGFMLLEVIFAVAVAAIGLFVLMEGLSRCVAAARSVQNYTVAQTLLANKAYEFRIERAQDDLDQDGQFEDYPGYYWERTLEVTEIEKLWKQTLTVYWRERSQWMSDSVVEYRYLPRKQQ